MSATVPVCDKDSKPYSEQPTFATPTDEPRGSMIFVIASQSDRCCDGTNKVRMSNPIYRSLQCTWGTSQLFRLPITCAGFRNSLLQPAIGSRRTSATSSPEVPHEIPKT